MHTARCLIIALALGGPGTAGAGPGAPAPPAKPAPAAPEAKPEGARLTHDEALRIAREELARLKVNAEKYKAPTATWSRKNKSWYVSYPGKEPKPGNHCSVSIDDDTGKARFIGGA